MNTLVGHDLVRLALIGDTRSFKKLVDTVPTSVLNRPLTLDTIDGILELRGLSEVVRTCFGDSNPKKVLVPLIVVISWIGTPRFVQMIIKRVDINANIRDDKPRFSVPWFPKHTFPNYMSIVETLLFSENGPHNFPQERVRNLRKIIRMLVERGLRLNQPTTPQNYSPLTSAVIAGDDEMFKLFVRHGADVSDEDINGENAYEYCHENAFGDGKWVRVIKWMVDNGYAKKKLKPLHVAIFYGNAQIVKYVLAKVYGGKVPTTRDPNRYWNKTVFDLVQDGHYAHYVPKSAKKKIFDIVTAQSRKTMSNALKKKTNLPDELRQDILYKAGLSRYRATNRRRNR